MSTATAAPAVIPSKSAPAAVGRMSLSNVKKGKEERPLRVVFYGPEGIGKSTFGANAPSPIFLQGEEGTSHLDVARFPKPQSWSEVLEAVRGLKAVGHEYKTLVVDTLDALEPLCWRHVCETFAVGKGGKARSIEDYGYGKGYVMALEVWRSLMVELEQLGAKGMHVILLAHAVVKPFKNPTGEDFDRYELKLHQKASGLFKEWCDSLLFANYETFAKKDGLRAKGVGNARMVFTSRHAAYDAKHRGNLPESFPLSWADFAAESAKEIDPKVLAADILRRAEELPEDVRKVVSETATKYAADVAQLLAVSNRVNVRLAEAAAAAESEAA